MAMSSATFVIDTNIALSLLGDQLVEPLPIGIYCASLITEMELLSYPKISDDQIKSVKQFLSLIEIIPLHDQIKDLAIQCRRSYQLKLPDAIIAATTQNLDGTLLTNDRKLINLPVIKTRSLICSS
jgi:predicted nucleic acid-binding protein